MEPKGNSKVDWVFSSKVVKLKKIGKTRKKEWENNKSLLSDLLAIYWVFGAALVFKNRSFRCFRLRALEIEFLYAVVHFQILGSGVPRGQGLVPGPRVCPAAWPSCSFASSPSPPARDLRKHCFVCSERSIWTVAASHTLETLNAVDGKTHTHCTSQPAVTSQHTKRRSLLHVVCPLMSLLLTLLLLSPTNLHRSKHWANIFWGRINNTWKQRNLPCNYSADYGEWCIFFNQDHSSFEHWQQSRE